MRCNIIERSCIYLVWIVLLGLGDVVDALFWDSTPARTNDKISIPLSSLHESTRLYSIMKPAAIVTVLAACGASVQAFVVSHHIPGALTFSNPCARLSAVASAGATSPQSSRSRRGVASISMKRKGKMNSDMQQRGSYNQMLQQEMQYKEQRRAMESGMPAFQIFARTPVNNMWYPCGTMMGDDKAKATVDAMMGGLLSGVSKYSLEKGIASSVLSKKRDLIRQVEQAYPQLAKKPLTFGFKVIYKGLEEKLGKQEITEINKDMTLGPMDSFKKKMGW